MSQARCIVPPRRCWLLCSGLLTLLLLPPSLACAKRASSKTPRDLTRLKVVNNVLSKVRTRYVEPRRLDPQQMLRRALEEVQRRVPEVIVRFPAKDQIELQVNKRRKQFSLEPVDSPWALSTALRTIFRFVQANLHPETKRQNVEYAAVEGMLKTLDCHSVLLRPEFFGEMKIHTRGSFGGLGITISRCGHPQSLTVVKPIPGTPAHRAGLKAGDKIVRIGKESTANLTLSEAVKRLRGKPGSKVTIWVRRGGRAPKSYTIERARVMIRAVDSKMLDKGVGYVRIKNFQSTTDYELRIALQTLKRKGLRGLVLDLRGNGGGLLSKAISVADAFLYSGTVVTTVEHGVRRRESRASWSQTLAGKIPLAVLVDGGSASASEIVAGALKNLDRAVIIGQRTYGKGSVQVIYPNRDGSGFKVTIAQYLTPGDRSIQGIGVIPDIELDPVEVKKDRVVYFSSGLDLVREGDRACSLQRASLARRQPAQFQLHHLAKEPPRSFRCEPCGAPPDWKPPPDLDEFQLDYPIQLGAKVVLRKKTNSRRRLLAAVEPLLKTEERVQEARIAKRLERVRGVDWSAAPEGAAKPRLSAEVKVGRDGTVKAGQPLRLVVTVKNAAGAGPAHRVRGVIHSTYPRMQHREVFIGRVAPGKTGRAEVKVRLPKGARPRADELSVEFFVQNGAPPEATCTEFRIQERAKPKFTYTRLLLDAKGGNGDGRLQPGESLRLRLRVKNIGKGAAGETYLRVKSLSGDAVSVGRGVFHLSGLKPGQSKTLVADFTAMAKLPLPKVKLRLSIQDCEIGVSTKETLVLPVATAGKGPGSVDGLAVPKRAGVPLYQSPAARQIVAWTRKRSRLEVEARFEVSGAHWLRVSLGKGLQGFVRATDVRLRRRGRPRLALRWRWLPDRPEITVTQIPDVTDRKAVKVEGFAKSEGKLTDVYISVRRLLRTPDRSRVIGVDYNKVFYRAATADTAKRLPFAGKVPLWPGSNLVTVTVRGADRSTTKRTFRVLRRTCRDGKPARPSAAARQSAAVTRRAAPAVSPTQ